MFANAMGADVTVISHSPSKKEDAIKLGAKHFVCSNDKDWAKPLKFKFDMIISTADDMANWDLQQYFSTLKVMGHYHSVGLPEKSIELKMFDFMGNGCYIGTSHIGNRPEMEAMLSLAASKGLKGWVEPIQISEDGCKEAVERLRANKNVRYRFTLTGYDDVFGKRT
jgi:alcohol dehydrogenase (NADP+)